ncbi:hypothetical protein Oweho_0015 [Owenweeksia hongkongensis DSM 17368]|uniref:Uncharacterized protein n=1 Tax=Owenweeksia hongkongensis (strain DSM 17368 / CIP 108786 / JCM 12287 / NRRL B-23963 / UST20020801) TaxID=926562 RepID=G8R531_OWEHD|nr:hypothetical protein Oweho_0015 [Owenweeksia hongkongensis DSM 17368]
MQSLVVNNNHGTVEAIKLLLKQLDPIQQNEIFATINNQNLQDSSTSIIRKPKRVSRIERVNELTKILVEQQNMSL